ncbi:MAG: OmpH family outer membrane protein [Bacteroidaceae bacterium]|nr:OmpH family outer membrane protein [Bacteroidaceae bacterium]
MKFYYITALAASLVLASCSNSEDEAQEATVAKGEKAEGSQVQRIAFVELDSIMTQYQLYKDYEDVLKNKGAEIQNTLAQKQRNLEQHAANLQKKYENGGFTTKDELEAAQNQIQNEQIQLQKSAEKLNAEFNTEQERINQEARDSIQAFLKDYNKTRKYDFVMVKAGDNLLIANSKYDITADVVKGLNKRYKGKKN